jgi:hypothetical protein
LSLAIFVVGIQVAPWILQQSCSKKKNIKKYKTKKRWPSLSLAIFAMGIQAVA